MKYDIKNLTLDEKISLVTGGGSFTLSTANGKLKEVIMADGPHGVRACREGIDVKATAMPSLFNVANTWNTELSKLQGETIAEDCIDNNIDILLAPGTNIKRNPLGGRNFEYFSEDPILSGAMARSYIEGVQSKGVGTSLKHYCLNNYEFERLVQSTNCDERAIHEIYLPAFEEAVKAKPYTVMCAYNMINGVYATENKKYFDILRNELGFDGVIISDWGATQNSARALKGTLDVRMPYSTKAKNEIKAGLEQGYITEDDIDRAVLKVIELIEKCDVERKTSTTVEQRHESAFDIASESIVLLKNDDILPLNAKNILLDGRYKHEPIVNGDGSSDVTPVNPPCKLSDELKKELPNSNVFCTNLIESPHVKKREISAFYKYVYENAYSSDVVVLTVGTGWGIEGEGYDRDGAKLSTYEEDLILNTAKVNENVVVVIYAGSYVDVSNWIDKVKGVVLAGYGGEEIQRAVAKVLSGSVNPSGKLSQTFPKNLNNSPFTYRGNGHYIEYKEGIFVGYRYYEKYNEEVEFPFGFGLSYSQFEYSNLKVEKIEEGEYNVSYNVKNVSSVDGKEVSQLYVKDVFCHVERPEKELKAFSKNLIKAGEEITVTHKLTKRDFSYYSTALNGWYLENGDFEILVGASCTDIKLKAKIKIELPFETQYSKYL